MIYSLKRNKELAIQGQPLEWVEVQLGINIAIAGRYQISMEGSKKIYLEDRLENEIVDLSNQVYEFTTSAPGQIKDRFVLTPQASPLLQSTQDTRKVYVSDNVLKVIQEERSQSKLRVYDLSGNLLLSETLKGAAPMDCSSLESGVYIVKRDLRSQKVLFSY